MREGPNTANRSHTLDTIPKTQDLDLAVVLISIWVTFYHMKKLSIPTLLLCPCTPLLGQIRLVCMQSVDTEYRSISPVFSVHHRQLLEGINQYIPYRYFTILNVFLQPLILSFGLDSLLSVIKVVYYITLFVDYYYYMCFMDHCYYGLLFRFYFV